jgi:hypothetical protein
MGMISRNTTIVAVTDEAAKASVKAIVSEETKAAYRAITAPPLDLKSRQIQAQGCWQAAASNPALLGYAADVEALKEVVRTLADDGLAYIAERTK